MSRNKKIRYLKNKTQRKILMISKMQKWHRHSRKRSNNNHSNSSNSLRFNHKLRTPITLQMMTLIYLMLLLANKILFKFNLKNLLLSSQIGSKTLLKNHIKKKITLIAIIKEIRMKINFPAIILQDIYLFMISNLKSKKQLIYNHYHQITSLIRQLCHSLNPYQIQHMFFPSHSAILKRFFLEQRKN